MPLELTSTIVALVLMLVPLIVLGRMALAPPTQPISPKLMWGLLAALAAAAIHPIIEVVAFLRAPGAATTASLLDLLFTAMLLVMLALAARICLASGRSKPGG